MVVHEKGWMGKGPRRDCVSRQLVAHIWRTEAVAHAEELDLAISVAFGDVLGPFWGGLVCKGRVLVLPRLVVKVIVLGTGRILEMLPDRIL